MRSPHLAVGEQQQDVVAAARGGHLAHGGTHDGRERSRPRQVYLGQELRVAGQQAVEAVALRINFDLPVCVDFSKPRSIGGRQDGASEKKGQPEQAVEAVALRARPGRMPAVSNRFAFKPRSIGGRQDAQSTVQRKKTAGRAPRGRHDRRP